MTPNKKIDYEPKEKPKRIIYLKKSQSKDVIASCKRMLDELEQKRHLTIQQRHLEATLQRQIQKLNAIKPLQYSISSATFPSTPMKQHNLPPLGPKLPMIHHKLGGNAQLAKPYLT